MKDGEFQLLAVPPEVVDPESLRTWERTRRESDPKPIENFPPLGLIGTGTLCRAVLGPAPAGTELIDLHFPDHIELLGGPHDPMVDGGVSLYRLPAEFVRRLAGADGRRDAEYLARWRLELLYLSALSFVASFLKTQSLPETTYAIFQDAACRATDLRWTLCLTITYL